MGVKIVAAPAQRGFQPVGPIYGVLGKDANAGLSHLVAANVRKEGSLVGVGQGQLDIVVAGLDAERSQHWPAGERSVEGSRRISAGHDAVVVLVELIA